MKTLQRILYLFLLTLAIVACERDYDMPPLNEPKYEGADANITIAALKLSLIHISEPTRP